MVFSLAGFLAGFLAACERAEHWIGEPQRQAGDGSAQCVRDEDCVLLPSALTCCIECPPAPPFEPAPSWVLGGMLIQLETDCAERDRACQEVRCDPVPQGCVARAACVNGRCTAVTSGCAFPSS